MADPRRTAAAEGIARDPFGALDELEMLRTATKAAREIADENERLKRELAACKELASDLARAEDRRAHELARANERICELLDHNTKLVEERRAVDIHYNVEHFHRLAGFEHPEVPTVPSDDVVRFRSRLVTEEYLEWISATYSADLREVGEALRVVIEHSPINVDLPAWADATEDLDYVVEGSRLMFGIDGRPLLREVQRANVDKFAPGGGRRDDGKVLKPPGWRPPDIAGELRKQGWRG